MLPQIYTNAAMPRYFNTFLKVIFLECLPAISLYRSCLRVREDDFSAKLQNMSARTAFQSEIMTTFAQS